MEFVEIAFRSVSCCVPNSSTVTYIHRYDQNFSEIWNELNYKIVTFCSRFEHGIRHLRLVSCLETRVWPSLDIVDGHPWTNAEDAAVAPYFELLPAVIAAEWNRCLTELSEEKERDLIAIAARAPCRSLPV